MPCRKSSARFSLQKCQYCELLDLVLYEEEHREDVLHRLEEIRYTPGPEQVRFVSGNTFWRVQAELSIHVFEETGWLVRKGCPSRNSWRAKCCWKWPGSVIIQEVLLQCECDGWTWSCNVQFRDFKAKFLLQRKSWCFREVGRGWSRKFSMLKFSMWALAFPPILFTWHYILRVFLKFVGIFWAYMVEGLESWKIGWGASPSLTHIPLS